MLFTKPQAELSVMEVLAAEKKKQSNYQFFVLGFSRRVTHLHLNIFNFTVELALDTRVRKDEKGNTQNEDR